MHELIPWAGFLGAWLLVLGPVYQAALELREEDLETERMQSVMAGATPPEPVSPWWLLVPPVWWWKRHQRRSEFQQRAMLLLSDEDYEAFHSFVSKALGWAFVGLGGLLIAVKETWELAEGEEWPTWLFWLVVVVMLSLCLANAGRSSRLSEKYRRQREDLKSSS